jgi:hypothetical protein
MSQWCDPAQVLCCICFRCTPVLDLYTDRDGTTWDVCKGACAIESGAVVATAWLDGRPIVPTLRSVVLPHALGATVDGITVTETPEQLGFAGSPPAPDSPQDYTSNPVVAP